jgi:hypothetical protein
MQILFCLGANSKQVFLKKPISQNKKDWFNTPSGFYTLVFLVIRITVDLFCIGVILYYHISRTKRQRYLRSMLKPIKKKIVSGQALKSYNDVNAGEVIDSEKLMHIQYPVFDSMPMPKMPGIGGGGGGGGGAGPGGKGSKEASPSKRITMPRLSLGFNLLEPKQQADTGEKEEEEASNSNDKTTIKEQRVDHKLVLTVPPVQQSFMSVPILNPLSLNSVCINETKNPMLPVTLNRKGDITSTVGSNYYKYVPDAANAYDMYLKSSKPIGTQSPPTPTAAAAATGQPMLHALENTAQPLSAKYYVNTDPNPATLTERKKSELHPQVSSHNDPNAPYLACQEKPDVASSNNYSNYEQQQVNSHHRFHQQQQMKRVDYARMILMDTSDSPRLRHNLIRAKSTDMELHRPSSALIGPSDSYKPYFYNNNNAVYTHYDNNHANYMYQPGMLLSNGEHPYFGKIF